MKNNYDKKNPFILLVYFVMGLLTISCSDNERMDMVTTNNTLPNLSLYSPTDGGKNTVLTLYGAHFGTSLDSIQVTVNSKAAIVTGVFGNKITATVQEGSGSGPVKVFIPQGDSILKLTYKTPFQYSRQAVVSTYAGAYVPTSVTQKVDTTLMQSVFWKPSSMAFGKDGGLYVIEDDDYDIRLLKDGTVQTFLRADATNGLIYRITDITFSPDKDTMYIANDVNGSGKAHLVVVPWNKDHYDVTQIKAIWQDTPVLGSGITDVAVHPITGEIICVAYSNAMIYEYDAKNRQMVATGVQLPNGSGGTATNVKIRSIIFDSSGSTVYMSSQARNVIYKGHYDMDSGKFSDLQVWVGQYGVSGYTDGQGSDARLMQPFKMDMDSLGNIYVAVAQAHRIAKISSDGTMTTFTGTGKSGTTDGALDKAQFNYPMGLKFGPDGAMYISEYWNHKIRKIEDD